MATSRDTSRTEPVAVWRLLATYAPLLHGQYLNLAAVFALMFVSTAVNLAIPIHAGRFVDVLTQSGNLTADTRPFFILGALLIAQLIGNFLYQYLSARLGLRVVTALRRRLFHHLLALPSLYFTYKKAGDLSSRVTSDVGSIQHLLTSGIVALIRAVVTLAGAIFLMFRLNEQLTVVVVLLVPATILLVSFFGRHLRRLSRRMYDELGELSNHVQEVAGAIRAIKVFGSQDHEQTRFQGRLDSFQQAGLRRSLLSAALDSGAQILLWICMITVVVYGFYLSGRGEASYGDLVAFLLLAFRVAAPMGSLTHLYAQSQGAAAAAARLDEILLTAPESDAMATSAAPASSDESATAGAALTLEGVSFRYGEDASWILEDVNATIASGEKVALVGPSGAGKTTLACLILRLFDPQAGHLALDSRPYPEFDLADLRGRMAYVPQEAVLYDATIEDNIRFGLTTASEAAVRLAAERAQALEFIEHQSEGFATLIGDRGVRLSGGERQRLALARAFLRDPEILVLDEPTSALDAASEEAVRQALSALMEGRTTIVVAHRLSLVRDLDRIIVLDRGQVIETGPHQDLLDRNGLYARLYHLQQGSGES